MSSNLEDLCSCNYITKDGKTIHSVTCKKSSFFTHEIRFGFAEVGLKVIKEDILRLEKELQETKAQLKQKDEEIEKLKIENMFSRIKLIEFINLVRDIEQCDSESTKRINLWIDGNRTFLDKIKRIK